MRPKKIILCVDPNENDLSVLAFMLSTNGFRVLAASTFDDAVDLFSSHLVDLALVSSSLAPGSGRALTRRLKLIAGDVPVILRGDMAKMMAEPCQADTLLDRKRPADALLETIRTMVRRKRGPRPSVIRVPPGSATLAAAVERMRA